MAKILIISRHVTETSLQLAKSLKNQQHEIYFFTGRDEPLHETFGIHFLTYFKKWSVFESVKFFPVMLGIQPDIIHFLLSNDEVSHAEIILSTIAKIFPRCVITTSILEIKDSLKKKTALKLLVKESDVVTVPSLEYMGHLRGIQTKSLRQARGILPPLLSFKKEDDSYIEHNQEEFPLFQTLKNKKYIVLPINNFFKNELIAFQLLKIFQEKNYYTVFYGSWEGYSLREKKLIEKKLLNNGIKNWIITGTIKTSELIFLLKNCQALYLAHLKLSTSEVAELFIRAISTNTTVIMDVHQASIYSYVWKNKENCWILDLDFSLTQLEDLLQAKQIKLNAEFNNVSNSNLLDNPINDLHRMYNKAFLQKTKPRTQL